MTDLRTPDNRLNWDVFVTPGIPMVTGDLPPGTKQGNRARLTQSRAR